MAVWEKSIPEKAAGVMLLSQVPAYLRNNQGASVAKAK